MLVTRRSDYATRIIRVLKDGNIHNVSEMCDLEEIPKAFAYKILRELEAAGLVKSERGNRGGYILNRSLEDITLYDIISITEDDVAILHCMKEECDRNPADMPCKVHKEFARIQTVLMNEMRKKSMAEILDN